MRKVVINKLVQKDIDQFDGREKQWIKAVVCYLEDENNSIELIKQKFSPLSGSLSGHYKAKHRGFGIRLIFEIFEEHELRVYFQKISIDSSVNEVIEIIAGGRRDQIYETVAKRVKK